MPSDFTAHWLPKLSPTLINAHLVYIRFTCLSDFTAHWLPKLSPTLINAHLVYILLYLSNDVSDLVLDEETHGNHWIANATEEQHILS